MSGNEGRDGQNTVQASLTGEEPTELTADELVLSAHEGTNADLFPKVLDLHVPTGSEVADVTYGKGVFWKNVPNDAYNLHASDIDPDKSRDFNRGVDCRDLPYEDNTFDCVVLDPPYAEGWFRRNKDHLAGGGTHSSFRDAYSNGEAYTGGGKYHQAVLDLYFDGGVEAKRVLKDDGTLLVKTQDEVSANTQELTHVQIINFYERELGLYTKDLFVLIRSNTPHQTGMHNQVHARKNHSYLLVFNFEKDPVNAPSNDD